MIIYIEVLLFGKYTLHHWADYYNLLPLHFMPSMKKFSKYLKYNNLISI